MQSTTSMMEYIKDAPTHRLVDLILLAEKELQDRANAEIHQKFKGKK